jgi:hypothetical protein
MSAWIYYIALPSTIGFAVTVLLAVMGGYKFTQSKRRGALQGVQGGILWIATIWMFIVTYSMDVVNTQTVYSPRYSLIIGSMIIPGCSILVMLGSLVSRNVLEFGYAFFVFCGSSVVMLYVFPAFWLGSFWVPVVWISVIATGISVLVEIITSIVSYRSFRRGSSHNTGGSHA